MAGEGSTLMLKSEDGVTVKTEDEVAVAPPTVTETAPVAAPAGIVKLMLVAEELTIGAEMVPPPCFAKIKTGDGARFAPVKII